MPQFQGKVDILGAGPGCPDFLTIAGQQILSEAEVLIYDALIDPRLLTLPQRNCKFIPMGKRGGRASVTQEEINHKLVAAYHQGKKVVRLKAGDPFIFGRTISEVQALEAEGCTVSVWPGISSVFAAPLMVGIPLTDKELSQTVTLMTGHQLEQVAWGAIAKLDTFVVLMGARNLGTICNELIRAGKSEHTPIAVIRWCSWPQQESWFGTLENIAQQLAGQSLSPAVVVIGKVVSLRHTMQLQPCTEGSVKPLTGKTIVITRAVGQVSQFRDRLINQGANVLEMPALEIVEPSDWQPLDEALSSLQQFSWLILTSSNAVDFFFARLKHRGLDSRALSGLKIAVVGRKTAAQLDLFGLKPDFIPPNYVADSMVDHFPEATLEGCQILFPRVESGGRDVLVREFKSQGAMMTEVPAYQSRCPEQVPQAVIHAFQNQSVDAVTFASSKTVKHFGQMMQSVLDEINPGQSEAVHSVSELIDQVCIASIGPQTSKTCRELFERVTIEAEEYTLEGLLNSLLGFYAAS